jgi:GNAT superfamily N-acetyltransferase
MTAADLHLLPEPCAQCAFWEASLSDLAAPTDHVDRGVVKAEWAEAVTRYWGYCGVMAFADDQPIAHLTLAPAMYVPRLGAFATTPVGPDAAVVMSAHVAAELRGKGLGKMWLFLAVNDRTFRFAGLGNRTGHGTHMTVAGAQYVASRAGELLARFVRNIE